MSSETPGVERFLGPALVSNRLSNGKGARRLPHSAAALALALPRGPRPRLSLLPAPPASAPARLSLSASLPSQQPPPSSSPSPPTSFCYLSISNSTRTPSRLERRVSSPANAATPPLITISVPPNTQFVPSDGRVRLSRSLLSSSPSEADSSTDDSSNASPDLLLHSPHSPVAPSVNTAPPPERGWLMSQRIEAGKSLATLSLLCYNVLSDKYASTSLYSYCPTWALNWEYRKKAILNELRHYDADIVSLQEVETEQFRVLFRPEMAEMGYEGIFSPKSRAKTMAEEEAKYVDGCALFWKSEKLSLEREELIEFTQMAIDSAQGNQAMLNRVMTRDNIALAAVFRAREGLYNFPPQSSADSVVGAPLVVCSAHVHWDPEFCDVKLVQTMMLVQKVSQLVKEVGAAFRLEPAKVPTLVCGDLNSLPNSGVIEYLTKGRVPRDHLDFKQFRHGAGDILCKLASHHDASAYHHPLRLASAYGQDQIPFTNYTLDFKGVIDYIFASPASLHKLGVLGPLDPAWLRQHKIIGCPHPHVPSDHIPILAQYALLPPPAAHPTPPHQFSNPNANANPYHHPHQAPPHNLWSHSHSHAHSHSHS